MLMADASSDLLHGLSDAITDVIGNHGLYAVFLLMLIDAVLPAASELVMVYAGAIAAGAFADQSVTLFGYEFESGFPAYLAMSLAGTGSATTWDGPGWSTTVAGSTSTRASWTVRSAGSTDGRAGRSSSGGSRRSCARSSPFPRASSTPRSGPMCG